MNTHSSPRRPAATHLVCFPQDQTNLAGALSKALSGFGKETAPGKAQPSSVRRFASRARGTGPALLYEHLNIAAVQIDASEAQALRLQGAIVVPNLERHALGQVRRVFGSPPGDPPITVFNAEDGPRPQSLPSGILNSDDGPPPPGEEVDVFPFHAHSSVATPSGGVADLDSFRAYLEGQRDSVATMIRRLRPSDRAPALLSPQLEASQAAVAGRWSWCLGLLGLRPDVAQPTGAGVKVAVLDTGLDLTHPDFSRVKTTNCHNSTASGASVQDGQGHGTHCCGVVAGPAESSTARAAAGVARYGVAPGVELLVGKVLDDQGTGWDSEILEGIAWAAEKGARVISLSLGSDRAAGAQHAVPYETVVKRLAAAGTPCLFVAAAGNESRLPEFLAPVGNPAACPSFLAIAAVDRKGLIARFSCGQRDDIGLVDLSAPGVGVLSSFSGGRYAEMDGTSMATPHVAGLAALYLEREPMLTVDGLWRALMQNATPLGSPANFGRGLARFV